MRPYYFMHAHSECEIVRRKLEQRIAPDVDLVKIDSRQKARQPEWLLLGDEMDLVPPRGERNAELRRHGT